MPTTEEPTMNATATRNLLADVSDKSLADVLALIAEHPGVFGSPTRKIAYDLRMEQDRREIVELADLYRGAERTGDLESYDTALRAYVAKTGLHRTDAGLKVRRQYEADGGDLGTPLVSYIYVNA